MPDWFRRKHPQFAATFRPLSESELEAIAEREAIQAEHA